jgi:nicotinamide mononucleotide transporter
MQIFTLLTGVIYIVLEIRQKNFMWVVGIATSLAAMWVFFRQGLYASFGLNTYYFITAFIGLWQWSRNRAALSSDNRADASKGGEDVVVLNKLTFKTMLVSFLVSVVGVLVLSYGMSALYEAGILGENPMSLLDSAVAVLSAVATWWLVKSYREQWWLWIVADTLSVALCAMQGMWWMAALYLAYVAAAVYGLHYWKERGVYLSD